MSNIFLVDLENVNYQGLINAPWLSEEDELIIFHSNHIPIDSPGVENVLKDCKAKITTKEIYNCGKNSLDFQLVAHLGTMIGKAKDNTFYIVSNDKDYCSVILYLQDKFDIYLIPELLINSQELKKYEDRSITEAKARIRRKKNYKIKKKKSKKSKKENYIIKLKDVSVMNNIDYDILLILINKSKNLNSYHNNLNSISKRKRTVVYYQTKDIFEKIKENKIIIKNTKGVNRKDISRLIISNLIEKGNMEKINVEDVLEIMNNSDNLGDYHNSLKSRFQEDGLFFYKNSKEWWEYLKRVN